MDWKKLISELNAKGVTQMVIAERCKVGQSTVSDLARGATESPSFAFGTSLVALHAEHFSPAPEAAKVAERVGG